MLLNFYIWPSFSFAQSVPFIFFIGPICPKIFLQFAGGPGTGIGTKLSPVQIYSLGQDWRTFLLLSAKFYWKSFSMSMTSQLKQI